MTLWSIMKSTGSSACFVQRCYIMTVRFVVVADSSEALRPLPTNIHIVFLESAYKENWLNTNGTSKWFEGGALEQALIGRKFNGPIPCWPLDFVFYWMMSLVCSNSRLLSQTSIAKPNSLIGTFMVRVLRVIVLLFSYKSQCYLGNIFTSRSAGVKLIFASLFCCTGCQADTTN